MTTDTILHFPVTAGKGTKVHWYTQVTDQDNDGKTRQYGRTACNLVLNDKTSFQIQPGEVTITCERCLKVLAAANLTKGDVEHVLEAEAGGTEVPVESVGDLVHTEPPANEFSFHYLFGLPDSTATRKEWRKLVRAIIQDQAATYIIEDGHYTVTLPSGFVYSFSRDDSGATYIDRE